MPDDPSSDMHFRQYLRVPLLAAILGVPISAAAYSPFGPPPGQHRASADGAGADWRNGDY
jgi:hypothetical protein